MSLPQIDQVYVEECMIGKDNDSRKEENREYMNRVHKIEKQAEHLNKFSTRVKNTLLTGGLLSAFSLPVGLTYVVLKPFLPIPHYEVEIPRGMEQFFMDGEGGIMSLPREPQLNPRFSEGASLDALAAISLTTLTSGVLLNSAIYDKLDIPTKAVDFITSPLWPMIAEYVAR